jgi:hypothetical protein
MPWTRPDIPPSHGFRNRNRNRVPPPSSAPISVVLPGVPMSLQEYHHRRQRSSAQDARAFFQEEREAAIQRRRESQERQER